MAAVKLYEHEHTHSTKSSDTARSVDYRLLLRDDATCLFVWVYHCWDKDDGDISWTYHVKWGTYQREIPDESRFGLGKVLCNWEQVWTSSGETWEREVNPEMLNGTVDLDYTTHGGKQTQELPFTADLGPTLGLQVKPAWSPPGTFIVTLGIEFSEELSGQTISATNLAGRQELRLLEEVVDHPTVLLLDWCAASFDVPISTLRVVLPSGKPLAEADLDCALKQVLGDD